MQKISPFNHSRPIAHYVAAALVIAGLLLILFAKAQLVRGVVIFGANFPEVMANFGFALLLIALFQWIFDYKFRERFFEDIRSEIVASQSLAQAGFIRAYQDSKSIDYSELILTAKKIEIGITYSERILKDYFDYFCKNDNLELEVIFVDHRDEPLVRAIAASTGQDVKKIEIHFKNLNAIIDELKAAGVDVKTQQVKSIPKYAFVRFDKSHLFFIPSTFVNRRTIVPAIEIGGAGFFFQLVEDDISASWVCQEGQ